MGREWWVCCWSLVLLQGLLLHCHGHGCWEEERLALLRLRPFFKSLDWNRYGPRSDCCNWDSYRILCDNATGRVTELHLQVSTGLDDWNLDHVSYYLNASLFLPFQHLTTLDLSTNSIAGYVKNEGFEMLSSIRNLETLYLYKNHFDKSVLVSLGHLSSLRSLDLSHNRLSGSLNLHEINSLKRLTELDLSSNSIESFQGSKGNGILNLTNLEYLELSGNLFNSNVLSFLRGLSSLKTLSLGNNRLERSIHVKEFDGLNNLEDLNLGSNPIESIVASNDGKVLEKLKTLDLSNVSVRGSNLLQFAGLFPSLTTLDLSYNTFNESTTGTKMNALTKLEELYLTHSSIQANFLQAFGALPSLQTLHMSGCNITGLHQQVLDGLCGLSNLQKLYMSSSGLNGSLPACFSNLTSLQDLDLWGNQFSGDLAFSPLRVLNSIQYLDLSYNKLSGDLAEFLYHHHELEMVKLSSMNFRGQHYTAWLLENNPNLYLLDLANASLSGSLTLPAHPHQSLSYFYISDNLLVGDIPREIGAFFPMLSELDISNNQLTGSIPSSIGDMKWLSSLDLYNNNLSGEIPASLAEGCSSLRNLILANNILQGEIPNGLSKCSSLNTLDFSDNNLSGGIPPSFGNMTSLNSIIMPNNALEGPLPEHLFNLPNLLILDFSGNLISGTIPYSLNLPFIMHIQLSKNKLQGRLPSSLCKSTRLITLDLGDNLFVNGLPRCIGELHELSYLILKHNSIKGEIPSEICQLSRISLVDLSYNNLSGSIPPCLNITPLTEHPTPDSEGIQFQTKSMSYLYKGRILSFFSGIDLSCNKLTGEIPEDIGMLNMIHVLNLSHNTLSGGIPLTVSNLKEIECLDLSFNNLQGGIPPEIVDLKFLSSFNVSFNNLSGPTPKRVDQFATFEEDSYKGNHFLCGEPLPSCNPAGPQFRNPIGSAHETEDGGLMDMGVFYISLISSYVTSLLAVLLVWWINPYWGRKWFYYVDMTTTSCYYYIVDHLPKCF